METHIHYTARTENLKTEKAFSTDFPVDHVEGARRKNTRPDMQKVTVAPMGDPGRWKLDVHGFCIVSGRTHLDAERVYEDKAGVQRAYWNEIEAVMYEHFPQYSRIECFDLTEAKEERPDYPDVIRAHRETYEQPSPIAHCDFSQAGSLTVLDWCFPGNEGFWEGKEFDILNVWRPLKEPTDDWTLALCDYTTVGLENDILLNDAIRRDRVEEICLIHFNEAHRWYCLKDQGFEDLLVFRNADTRNERARAFHAAVHNPESSGPSRESVEVRMVAFY